MSTYETAETKFIPVNGVKFAYRLFGASAGIPLFLHIHFRGTMDHWDPLLINPLAAQRPILLIDNTGVGLSEGEIPPTFAGWAKCIADVIEALNIPLVDALGFSMGGYTGQMLVLNHAHLIRRLILAGTGPSAGPDTVPGPKWTISTLLSGTDEPSNARAIKQTFFPQTMEGQLAADRFWDRVLVARPSPGRSSFVSREGAKQQLVAAGQFLGSENREEGSYDRLGEIRKRVLVVNGSEDVVIPTENSIVLFRKMVDARVELHLFPRSGHGFLDQHAGRVAALINGFLDEEEDDEESGRTRARM